MRLNQLLPSAGLDFIVEARHNVNLLNDSICVDSATKQAELFPIREMISLSTEGNHRV